MHMLPEFAPHLSGQFQVIYTEVKYWLSIGAVVWTILKIMNWVKKIKETDLVNIQTGVHNLNTELVKQTTAIVNELKESRADFRTFFVTGLALQPQPARMRAARTRKETVTKEVSTEVE